MEEKMKEISKELYEIIWEMNGRDLLFHVERLYDAMMQENDSVGSLNDDFIVLAEKYAKLVDSNASDIDAFCQACDSLFTKYKNYYFGIIDSNDLKEMKYEEATSIMNQTINYLINFVITKEEFATSVGEKMIKSCDSYIESAMKLKNDSLKMLDKFNFVSNTEMISINGEEVEVQKVTDITGFIERFSTIKGEDCVTRDYYVNAEPIVEDGDIQSVAITYNGEDLEVVSDSNFSLDYLQEEDGTFSRVDENCGVVLLDKNIVYTDSKGKDVICLAGSYLVMNSKGQVANISVEQYMNECEVKHKKVYVK